MTRNEVNQAIRLSLLMSDSGPERHNVYKLRARQERVVQALVRPVSGNVSNVVPIRRTSELPPAA